MEVMDAIKARRSIRKFKPDPIAREVVEEILLAASLAPSAKNRQPWRFVVVQGKAKDEMAVVMRQGLVLEEKERGHIPGYGQLIAGAHYTLNIMEQAPVTVFIVNPDSPAFSLPKDVGEGFFTIANLQSIGAAIQNLILEAESQGLGSLWICDIFSAYQPLLDWLGTDEQLIAAVSLGYADETPAPRPRKALDSLVEWK